MSGCLFIPGDFLCIRFVHLILEKCIIPAQNFGFMPSELLLAMHTIGAYIPLRVDND